MTAQGSPPGGSFPDKLLGHARPHSALTCFCACSQGWAPFPSSPLSLLFTLSSPAAKMPSPQAVTSGPELHSPKEPVEPQTPERGARRASSGDAWPGLGTFRRAFSRTSQRASGRTSEEELGLLRRSSRFLLRSLRRAPDDSPAADPCQDTAAPGHSPEVPSSVMDGVSQQWPTGMGPEELETEAGKAFTNNTKHGRKLRRQGGAAKPRLPDRLSSTASSPNPYPLHNYI